MRLHGRGARHRVNTPALELTHRGRESHPDRHGGWRTFRKKEASESPPGHDGDRQIRLQRSYSERTPSCVAQSVASSCSLGPRMLTLIREVALLPSRLSFRVRSTRLTPGELPSGL